MQSRRRRPEDKLRRVVVLIWYTVGPSALRDHNAPPAVQNYKRAHCPTHETTARNTWEIGIIMHQIKVSVALRVMFATCVDTVHLIVAPSARKTSTTTHCKEGHAVARNPPRAARTMTQQIREVFAVRMDAANGDRCSSPTLRQSLLATVLTHASRHRHQHHHQ